MQLATNSSFVAFLFRIEKERARGFRFMKHTKMICENYIFRRLYHRGKSHVSSSFVVYVIKKKGRRSNNLGITTTKKIGGAVKRNRARRVILEAYRLLEDELPCGLDIVIVARARAADVKMQVVKTELARILGKL